MDLEFRPRNHHQEEGNLPERVNSPRPRQKVPRDNSETSQMHVLPGGRKRSRETSGMGWDGVTLGWSYLLAPTDCPNCVANNRNLTSEQKLSQCYEKEKAMTDTMHARKLQNLQESKRLTKHQQQASLGLLVSAVSLTQLRETMVTFLSTLQAVKRMITG